MDQEVYDFSNSESIADLGLRFFSPTEVARLHVFPLNEKRDDDNMSETGDVSDEKSIADSSSQSLTSVRPFNPRLSQNPSGPFLQFPEKLKAIQRYKLLGNSLNVWVVAELLRGILFADHPGNPQPVYRVVESNGGERGERATGDSNYVKQTPTTKHDIEEQDGSASHGDNANDNDAM
ncbi:hypothetical protein BGZ80_003163 [Entomortierella chlamydospora]|uniref:Uncharacterized protein n=1 Tax=Entomortierella chlamydospora TaxID=101097 RepID=A0A9P6N2D2_9FUNG|nr:hypothetical protein BGZ80_003163 [Entomortierella chlamydospora]